MITIIIILRFCTIYFEINHLYVFKKNLLFFNYVITEFFNFTIIAIVLSFYKLIDELTNIKLLFIICAPMIFFCLLFTMRKFKIKLVITFLITFFLIFLFYGYNLTFFNIYIQESIGVYPNNYFTSVTGKDYYFNPRGLLTFESIKKYLNGSELPVTAIENNRYKAYPLKFFYPIKLIWKSIITDGDEIEESLESMQEWKYNIWFFNKNFTLKKIFNYLVLENFFLKWLNSGYADSYPFFFWFSYLSLIWYKNIYIYSWCYTKIFGNPEEFFFTRFIVTNECHILILYITNKFYSFLEWFYCFENICFLLHFFIFCFLVYRLLFFIKKKLILNYYSKIVLFNYFLWF